MPRRHFQCCSNVVWLPTYSQSTCLHRLHVSNCLCLEHLEKAQEWSRSKYVQMVCVVVARGFHFRDVFLHLQEVTRWHTNFVQRGSFDFAISGGQKGVGNIGNFMQFHAMSYQYWISWLDAWLLGVVRTYRHHDATVRVSYCSVVNLWVSEPCIPCSAHDSHQRLHHTQCNTWQVSLWTCIATLDSCAFARRADTIAGDSQEHCGMSQKIVLPCFTKQNQEPEPLNGFCPSLRRFAVILLASQIWKEIYNSTHSAQSIVARSIVTSCNL